MNRTKKILLMVLAIAMVGALSVGGTMAYLTKQSEGLTNTFAAMGGGKLLETFSLLEAPVACDARGEYSFDTSPEAAPVSSISYKVAPGVYLPKDPYIEIGGKTEVPCYLFMEACDSITGVCGMSWEVADGWVKLDGVTGGQGGDVYLYSGEETADGIFDDSGESDDYVIHIIKNNEIVVEDADEMEPFEDVSLSFYAYIAQASAGDTPADVFNTCFGN